MDSHDSHTSLPHHLHHFRDPPPPPRPGHTMMISPPPPSHPNNNVPIMQQQQSTVFPFNSAVNSGQKPAAPDFSGGSSPRVITSGLSIEPPEKKKRGRPRKYSPDGKIALGLSPTPVSSAAADSGARNGSISGAGSGSTAAVISSENQARKIRGRPAGSVKKQIDDLGLAGFGFTPHVITVKAGEDIAQKIMEFSQQGPRTICILSANGTICNVTLRQPATCGGTMTLEGRFEIVSLSGSFLPLESNGSRSRSGGLSVSLAGADGKVVGGGVSGMLIAASPVQVVVGSFIADGKRPKQKPLPSPMPPSNVLHFGAPVVGPAGSPPSEGASSESNDENGGSPMPMYSNMGWPPNSTAKTLP